MTLPLPDPKVDLQAWELERQGVQRNFEALALAMVDTGGRQLKVRFGSATMPFGAASSGPVTVAVTHGVGTTPVAAYATYAYTGNTGLFAYVQSITSTQITFRGVGTGIPGADQTFYWLAIG